MDRSKSFPIIIIIILTKKNVNEANSKAGTKGYLHSEDWEVVKNYSHILLYIHYFHVKFTETSNLAL